MFIPYLLLPPKRLYLICGYWNVHTLNVVTPKRLYRICCYWNVHTLNVLTPKRSYPIMLFTLIFNKNDDEPVFMQFLLCKAYSVTLYGYQWNMLIPNLNLHNKDCQSSNCQLTTQIIIKYDQKIKIDLQENKIIR